MKKNKIKKMPSGPVIHIVESADLFIEKNAEYGNIYKAHSKIMKMMFPNGVELRTEGDFALFGAVNSLLSKLHRFAHIYGSKGKCHTDSLKDLIVYAGMALESGEHFDLNVGDTKMITKKSDTPQEPLE